MIHAVAAVVKLVERRNLIVVGQRQDGQILRAGVWGLHLELANEWGQVDALQEAEGIVVVVVIIIIVLILVADFVLKKKLSPH